MIALHYQPDPNRHIVRLPGVLVIGGKNCIKAYATDTACVYLNYAANGFDTLFKVYGISRVNHAEVLGALIGTSGDLNEAVILAGKS